MAKHFTTETEQHQAAWQFYLSLGPDRSLQRVAAKFGVAATTAKNWATAFGWQQRLAEHEARVARRAIDLAEKQGVEVDARAKARNLKLVNGAMIKLAQALATGDVKFNMSDISRLIQLEQSLTGADAGAGLSGGPSALDADLAGKSAEELWALAAAEVRALNRLSEWDAEVEALVAQGKIAPMAELRPPSGRCPFCGHALEMGADSNGDEET